jgi:arsenate reductase
MDEYLHLDFDFVITVCDSAKERCPVFPTGALKFHHNFDDPPKAQGAEEEKLNVFRRVRDEIHDYAKEFCKKHLKEA